MCALLLRCACVASLLSPLCLFCGCNSAPRTLRVTGTVHHKGKPVQNLFVNFVPAEGRSSWGVTDEEGRFKLSYDRQNEGAVAGKHKVYFEFRPRDPKQDLEYQQGKLKLPAEFNAILAKYSREKSTLSYEITRDEQVIDIELN
jgi:hypothetical protein